MIKYYVELDGISMIASRGIIEKNDLLVIYEFKEENYYKVRAVNGNNNLVLRLMKTVENTEDGVKYYIGEQEVFFNSRLSKNQMITVNGTLYKVLDIEKKTNILTLEEEDVIESDALYGVYESRVLKGLTSRNREENGYMAEKYFTEWNRAVGYVMSERSKGRNVSL